ncbi:glutamate--cysteine ligase [Rhodoligotrophos ferricapiens]|uniref:glutamate--cysteine ligase n=1 Tax=Rhodoligotrophos ferricapiens TaxID=3069264 RepID=UPI00315D0B06
MSSQVIDSPDTRVPVESKDQLVAWFEAGCKPKDSWRIGTEHEKFGFHPDGLRPVPYEGSRGIRALLEGLQDRFHWQPVMERDTIIGLKEPETGASISLEPGGQFELSGAAVAHLHQTCEEVGTHLNQVREVGDDLGINFLGLGFSPRWTLAETPMMPKGRYRIMRAYMPKVGGHGLDMMFRSCTVQVNLDFSTEADMRQKLRTSLALQPIATAIFANSPFTEGRPNGFLSFRSEIWRDTDSDRTGMLPFVFESGFDFERYVNYALDVPMYFVYRDGAYIDVSGKSFRDFMAGKLPQLPGERPTMQDWSDHVTTIFPEVRLKRYLEMRGADSGPWSRLCALPALWVGLLYDQTALDAAWDVVKGWTANERQALRDDVPKTALQTRFRRYKVQDIAREIMAIAREGLRNRDRQDGFGNSEAVYLNAIDDVVESGRTAAEDLLELYYGAWNESVDPVFKTNAY